MFKDFKRFEVATNKLWFTFKSGRSKTAYGYKFSVQGKFAEEVSRLKLSLVDSQRSIIVQSQSRNMNSGSPVNFLNDVLKDLKEYPMPSDTKDSHLHEMIRLYASLVMANLTMTEVYGADGSVPQNLESYDPVLHNIKAILKRQLSFKYFFPPADTTNPLILRLSALCLSELLELETNRIFSDQLELSEVVDVVIRLANETDISCAFYGMKALCLLAVEKNHQVLLQCGALTTFYYGSRKIKDPNVLKFVWQGFQAMAKYLDKSLSFESPKDDLPKFARLGAYAVTTDRTMVLILRHFAIR